MTTCPKCSHDASDHGAYTCWRGCGCGMHVAPFGAWCETTVPIPEHRCVSAAPEAPPSPPAETASAGWSTLSEWTYYGRRYRQQVETPPPALSAAPAAPEVDLGEVPALLAAVFMEGYHNGRGEGCDADESAAREAVEAAVRSLVERARREGAEAVRDAADAWGHDTRDRRDLPTVMEDAIRALTPAVPGAADEEG